MSIETSCSGCGKKLSVADEHAGKQARCPACQQIYTVPYPSAGPLAGSPSSSVGGPGNLADTSPGNTASGSANPYDAGASQEFWMRAPDGNEYGPVDRANLNRWFQEGRVGPQYQIRQGVAGAWQPAGAFEPSTPQAALGNSGNPYAAANPYQPARPLYRYPKSDQSGLILAMGILGFFVCPIFGVIAWVMGNGALKDIAAGNTDPANKGMVQAGYYLGMVSTILAVLCMGGYVVIFAIAIVSGA
ncbi:MAG: DUF4190 domain-containing protein [Pirellulaceae bacterium]